MAVQRAIARLSSEKQLTGKFSQFESNQMDYIKFIFLACSIIFCITGISQAMDTFMADGFGQLTANQLIFDFQYLTVSITLLPGFVRILMLSFGFFALYLLRRKLKKLGMGKLSEYIME